jgi:DNA polymerase
MSCDCPKCGGTGVSALRRAIQAPPGHVIVVRDLSAIEARVNAWLAGQDDMVETFRRGEDIYCEMYQSISGRAITKKDKNERFLGKTIVLGCGYGLGWRKFQTMLRVGMLGDKGRILGWDIAKPLGVNLDGFMHRFAGYVQESLPPGGNLETHALHCACAAEIIKSFRDNKPMIPKMWDTCQTALGYILRGEEFSFGPNNLIKTCKEGLVLPNGMIIRYTELEGKPQGRRIEYKILKNRRKNEWGKVYGGLVDENLVQALSRIILTDAMLQLRAEGMRAVHQVHDEILTVARESEAEAVYTRMGELMSTPPPWAPDLPLASEGGWNQMYIK